MHHEDELHDLSLSGQVVTFDLDSYKLLVKALMGCDGKPGRLIKLPYTGTPDVLMS
ncbi:MAG: hypothetical protein R6W86_11350 [Marinobacter sp.]|uniref:hypothetical protein n=1 Tax=Marinobacter sp. TaxID=50741 RepID=UPI00396E295E